MTEAHIGAVSVVEPYCGHSKEDIQQVRDLFKQWDLNNDGGVTRTELHDIITQLDPDFPDQDLSRMFNAADLNHDGKIDVDEFITWIFASEEHVQELMPSVDLKTNTVLEEPKVEPQAEPVVTVHSKYLEPQKTLPAEPPEALSSIEEKVEHSKGKGHVHSKHEKLKGHDQSKHEVKHHSPRPVTASSKKEEAQIAAVAAKTVEVKGSHLTTPMANLKEEAQIAAVAAQTVEVKGSQDHAENRQPSRSPRLSTEAPKRASGSRPSSAKRPSSANRHAAKGHHRVPTTSSDHHVKGGAIASITAQGDQMHHEERLKEERNTSVEELWETLLGLRSKIPTEEVVALFDDAFQQDLHQVFPQVLPNGKEIKCDLLTTAQVVAMAIQLQIHPDTTTDALYTCALQAAPDYEHSLEQAFAALSGNDTFKLETFRRLIKHMAILMKVEEQTIISHLIWVKLRRFELTDSQYDILAAVLLRHRPREHQGKAKSIIDGSDFELLCRFGNLIDPMGQEGMAVADCYAFFDRILENIESYVRQREHTHPGLVHETHFCHHRHALRGGSGGGNGFVGRTEMTIFLDEFFKCAPHHSGFRSPLMLTKVISNYNADADITSVNFFQSTNLVKR